MDRLPLPPILNATIGFKGAYRWYKIKERHPLFYCLLCVPQMTPLRRCYDTPLLLNCIYYALYFPSPLKEAIFFGASLSMTIFIRYS